MSEEHLEDTSEDDGKEFTDEQLRAALKDVGATARQKAFAAGLPVVFLKDGCLVALYSDGRTEVVERLPSNGPPDLKRE